MPPVVAEEIDPARLPCDHEAYGCKAVGRVARAARNAIWGDPGGFLARFGGGPKPLSWR
jgi:hypothetical protein